MFFFHDQGDSHPLGAEWTMSPEPWTEDRLYIGYSVEDPCLSYDVIPAEERANRAWILAKVIAIFVSFIICNSDRADWNSASTSPISIITTSGRSKRQLFSCKGRRHHL
jgi:hypothetical protein